MTAESDPVRCRYDELADLLSGMAGRPPADPVLVSEVAPRLAHEARLLDAGCFEQWAELWCDDAVLWVPVDGSAHPATDQSLFLDDRRRLLERVRWRQDPSAWGQNPPSRTVRAIAAVEAWPHGEAVAARSVIVIDEHRQQRHQQLAGFQIHEMVGDDLRLRSKILVFPSLELGVRNPSFIL